MSRSGPQGWMERWYRLMLLGYPPQYRSRHGDELVGTILEAHPTRRLPSPRESVRLLDAGVLTRLRSRVDQVPAWVDGLQLGVLLLTLTQVGSLLGDALTGQHRPQLRILLPAAVLVMVAMLLGRMGIAGVVALIPAVLMTDQALRLPRGGTDYLVGVFASRRLETSHVHTWLPIGGWSPFWLIAVGSLVLAAQRRFLLRRSWWWLTIPVLHAALFSVALSLRPTSAFNSPNQPPPVVAGSVMTLAVGTTIVTIGFLVLALRATVAIGDPRWAIAAATYVASVVVSAAAIALAQPNALVTLDGELPSVVLAAACVGVLLRRRRRVASG